MVDDIRKSDIIDFLRFLATMFVFFLHSKSYLFFLDQNNAFLRFFFPPAWGGVWIFIFISAYLFSLQVQKGRYCFCDLNGKIILQKIWKYYFKRFLKLAPMYYFYIIFFELFSLNSMLLSNPKNFLKLFFFCSNGVGAPNGIGHLWYVSTIFQLYLLFPFLYVFFERLKEFRISLFIFILISSFLWRVLSNFFKIDWYSKIYTFSISNLDFIFAGFITTDLSSKFKSSKTHMLLSDIFFFLLIIFNNYIYSIGFLSYYKYLLPSLYILICSYLILAHVEIDYKICFFKAFSKISYNFYIFHIAVLVFTSQIIQMILKTKSFPNSVVLFLFYVFSFCITFLISYFFSCSFALKKDK